jgi:hypothetical protein
VKLIVTDAGDPSVGIYAVSWEVECPMEFDKNDKEELEFFRDAILAIYKEYCNGNCYGEYDFEIRAALLEPFDKDIDYSHKCTFCKVNHVDSDNGVDTCDECLRKQ